MMSFSRRELANYGVQNLLAGEAPAKIAERLAAALIAAKKPKEADLLLDDISEILESRGLLAKVTSTTAEPLTNELRKELEGQIKEAANVKEVALNEEVDKKVIGGIRVATANHTWDKTIARKLADIRGGI